MTGPSSSGQVSSSAAGLILALASAFFIGGAFILKKKGLMKTGGGLTNIYKSPVWVAGVIILAVGEILNFVAYAFAPAILVTPVGAVSVVISATLADIFLKEKLTMTGKVACFQCVVGTVIIILHGPAQTLPATMDGYLQYAKAPIFLVWTGLLLLTSSILAVCAWKTQDDRNNMMRYITVCSLTGSLSIVATQGVGPAIVLSISDPPNSQIYHWFFWFTLAFMTVTLITELIYLNRALGKFNAAIVTPVYYVTFTTSTIVSTSIFAQGYDAPAVSICTGVLGFFVICSGVYLLQVSKRDRESPVAAADDQHALTVSASELRANPLKTIQDVVSEISMRSDTSEAVQEGRTVGVRRNISLPFHRWRGDLPGQAGTDQFADMPESARAASTAASEVEGTPEELMVGSDDSARLSLTEFGRSIKMRPAINLRTGEHANIVTPQRATTSASQSRNRGHPTSEEDLDIDVHILER